MKKRFWYVIACLAFAVLACNYSGTAPQLPWDATQELLPSVTQPPPPASPALAETSTIPPPPTLVPAVRVTSGDRYLFMGDWENALAEYQAAFLDSQDAEIKSAALLGIGRARYLDGDYEASAAALGDLIQNYPQSSHLPYAHFNLGQVYNALERYVEAGESFSNYLALRSGVVDAYVLNLRGDVLRSAGDFSGAANDYRATLQSPGLLDGLAIEVKLARVHAQAGDYDTAIAMYDDLYNRSTSDYLKAQLDLFKGQAYTQLGQMDNAYAAYLDAVNNFPTSYDSYQALLALVEAGVPVDDLNRGIVDYHAAQYGVALAAFDRYFQSGAPDAPTARYYNGLTLRALGGHGDAIKEWDKIIQNFPDNRFWDDAWEQKAYTQWFFLGQFDAAIQTLLDFVASAPSHPRAGEFLYDAALVAERDGRLEQAAEIWERVASEYPGYEKAWRGLFLAGVTRYRQGDYPKAYALFSRALANAVSLQERSAAYYWEGKVQTAMGDPASAKTTWELAANVDPTGYYSERARDVMRGLAPFTPPQAYDLSMDIVGERAQAEAWLRTTFNLPEDTDLSSPGPLLSDPRFQRGTELWELGLYEESRLEFEDLRNSIQASPADSFRLANHLLELGLYRSAILSARQVLTLAGMDDAGTMSAPAYFNHVRFGAYFGDLIIPTAQKYNLHPLFLFSLVRQESAFEGFVRSSAGARGLMQIIPATGLEVATRLDWPPDYSAEDLYRPTVSIALGTDYLAHWRDRLGGDLYAALAAYNGGPGNATEWQSRANADPDIFLEVIWFEETRNYIRGVYEIFNIYRRLYDRSP